MGDLLNQGGVEHELDTAAGERVVVSVDDNEIFLYASTREQAERARRRWARLPATVAGRSPRSCAAGTRPPRSGWIRTLPLPSSDTATEQEHAELIAQERLESATRRLLASSRSASSAPRIATPSSSPTALRSEGIPYLRRWRYLLIGATDEESAAALAERLSAEAPPGSTVTVEASLAAIDADSPGQPVRGLRRPRRLTALGRRRGPLQTRGV